MEFKKPQFDVNLGGSVELPIEFNIMKFAAARAQEISDLSQTVEDSGKTSLIFQRLPRHMRRRVMSHNAKRLPRNVRKAHEEQMQATGAPVSRKRPSRKYRRRPANLLAEYNRRQRKYVWLETHIWHAKRFHMTELWGYRLPFSPNDKSYRACYRAASKHCLLQDISFLCCVEIVGPFNNILSGLSQHTSSACGLTFAGKSFLDGTREGELMLYERGQYPKKAIGAVTFIWKPAVFGTESRCIWIWVHPAYHKQVVDAFITTFQFNKVELYKEAARCEDIQEESREEEGEKCDTVPSKRPKLNSNVKKVEEMKLANRNVPFERTPKFKSKCGNIFMTLLKDTLNRFRLTGPLSQAVLEEALHLVRLEQEEMKEEVTPTVDITQEKSQDTVPIPMDIDSIFATLDYNSRKNDNKTNVSTSVSAGNKSYSPPYAGSPRIDKACPDKPIAVEHHKYWESLQGLLSPAELPPHMVLSLVVRDPRLQIPDKRSKAVPKVAVSPVHIQDLAMPPSPHTSSIWSPSARDEVTKSKLSAAEINTLRSKLVVPGILRTSKGPSNPDSSVLGDSVRVEIPLLLIQRPGSQDPTMKRIGFGCGWDVILPAGWAMPLWLALIFRCGRPAGLREASAHLLESSLCDSLPPDTLAGHEEEMRKAKKLTEAYFRLPPNKRPNYIKLGVACPFMCNWSYLLRDWAVSTSDFSDTAHGAELYSSFFVLRDRKLLREFADLLRRMWNDIKLKKGFNHVSASKALELAVLSVPDPDHCLLPVKVEAVRRGVTDSLSMICIPSLHDVSTNISADPVEELHEDSQRYERQKMRKEHKALLLRLRGQRVRANRLKEKMKSLHNVENLENLQKVKVKNKNSPTAEIVMNHRKKMEEMWLPNLTQIGAVKSSGSRKTAGFVTKGDFSFTEAKGCGVGYIAIRSLLELVQIWFQNTPANTLNRLKTDNFIVLIRSPSKLQYRSAKLSILAP